jgi:hypothetical protein
VGAYGRRQIHSKVIPILQGDICHVCANPTNWLGIDVLGVSFVLGPGRSSTKANDVWHGNPCDGQSHYDGSKPRHDASKPRNDESKPFMMRQNSVLMGQSPFMTGQSPLMMAMMKGL